MSHIGTIVKVKAKNSKEAIEIVNGLVTDDHEFRSYNTPYSGFDWCDEDGTKVLPKFTEKEFKKLRQEELDAYHDYKNCAEKAELKDDPSDQAYNLEQAARALDPANFWSYNRSAYDMTEYGWDDQGKEGKTFYVETDRHY